MPDLTDEQIRNQFEHDYGNIISAVLDRDKHAMEIERAYFDGARFAERVLQARPVLPRGWGIECRYGNHRDCSSFVIERRSPRNRLTAGVVVSLDAQSIAEVVLAELARDLLGMCDLQARQAASASAGTQELGDAGASTKEPTAEGSPLTGG